MSAVATRITPSKVEAPFTLGEAFKKYGRRWMNSRADRQGRRQLSEHSKYISFANRIAYWEKTCRWLDGDPLSKTDDEVSFPSTKRNPMGRKMTVRVFDRGEFETIDRRMKAQREGVWYFGQSGKWYSGTEYRRGEHGQEDVTEFVSEAAGERRHAISSELTKRFRRENIVGSRLHKTHAQTPPRLHREMGDGYEWLSDARLLADAVKKSRGEYERRGKRQWVDPAGETWYPAQYEAWRVAGLEGYDQLSIRINRGLVTCKPVPIPHRLGATILACPGSELLAIRSGPSKADGNPPAPKGKAAPLGATERAILRALKPGPLLYVNLADAAGYADRTCRTYAAQLIERGLIQKVGERRGVQLTTEGRQTLENL